MNKQRLLNEIWDWTADPMDAPLCKRLIELIEEDRPMGKMIVRLMEFAEYGKFKQE